jgi:hypothetical protein
MIISDCFLLVSTNMSGAMIEQFAFGNLSYYEFKTARGFVAKYPSEDTTLVVPLSQCVDFEVDPQIFSDDFEEYFRLLHKNNFGLSDIFWWLPPFESEPLTKDRLLKLIENTMIAPFGEPTDCVSQSVVIRNDLFPDFSVSAYFTSTPSPQVALDVVPFFVPSGTKHVEEISTIVSEEASKAMYESYPYMGHSQVVSETLNDRVEKILSKKPSSRPWSQVSTGVMTALGYKRESDRLEVLFPSGERLKLLKIGIFGNVIFGEHLEPVERKNIKKAMIEFDKTHKPVFILKQNQISPVLRTLAEEAGIGVGGCKSTMVYVGYQSTHDAFGCRDIRYGSILGKTTYGYARKSTAHTVVAIFQCDPPKNPVPTDFNECTKPTILPVSVVEQEFGVGKKFEPAFPAHVGQFGMAISFLNNLL